MEENALILPIERLRPVLRTTPAGMQPLPSTGVRKRPGLREEGGEALVLKGIAHDARNLVTALGLCAELMSEPGVLSPRHGHFATEVRSLAEATGRLVRRLAALAETTAPEPVGSMAETPVKDLAEAVRQLSGLLSAIAGPAIELQIACLPCAGQLRLSEESLSRILVNLVCNAADAMPTGGRIRITTQWNGGRSFLWALGNGAALGEAGMLSEKEAARLWGGAAETPATGVLLTVEDDGPGIPEEFLGRVFEAGFSAQHAGRPWPGGAHHGLGLSIVRTLAEAAGGTARAVRPPARGARVEIELPLTNVTACLPSAWAPGDRSDSQ